MTDRTLQQALAEALNAALKDTVGTLGWLRSDPHDPPDEWRANARAILATRPMQDWLAAHDEAVRAAERERLVGKCPPDCTGHAHVKAPQPPPVLILDPEPDR